MRLCIVAQKATVAAGYGCFLVLFLRLRDGRDEGKWALFGVVTFLAAILNLATVRDVDFNSLNSAADLSRSLRLPSRCRLSVTGPSRCARGMVHLSQSSTRGCFDS